MKELTKDELLKLKREWQKNQSKITGKGKATKEKRLELIERNREIWNIIGTRKESE